MIITDIIRIDKRKSKIYIDNCLFCALYNGEISKLGILPEHEVTKPVYDEIMMILSKRCRERSFYILKTRDYTEKEMRIKLSKSYFPKAIIDITIDFLQKYAYIDDERFTQIYFGNHINAESVKAITYKLKAKGISSDLIEQCIDEHSVDPCHVIEQKYSGKIEQYRLGDEKERRRIYNMLLRKGFSYEDINRVLKSQIEIE